MTTYEFKLTDALNGESSRASAIKVREEVLAHLRQCDVVSIDIENSNFTPSVADELIGGLAEFLGSAVFKQKVKVLNASSSDMALMQHVIARRLSKHAGHNG